MDDINVPIFSQAKLEYTKQLVDILYMNMYDGIRSIYDDAKVVYVKKRAPIVTIFRSLLEQVPKWNSEIIQNETDRIEKTSKCDWLDELLTAVFISHTRILMSIGSNHNFNLVIILFRICTERGCTCGTCIPYLVWVIWLITYRPRW